MINYSLLIILSPLIITAALYSRFSLYAQDKADELQRIKDERDLLNSKLMANKLFTEDLLTHIRTNKDKYPKSLYEYIRTIEDIYYREEKKPPKGFF